MGRRRRCNNIYEERRRVTAIHWQSICPELCEAWTSSWMALCPELCESAWRESSVQSVLYVLFVKEVRALKKRISALTSAGCRPPPSTRHDADLFDTRSEETHSNQRPTAQWAGTPLERLTEHLRLLHYPSASALLGRAPRRE
eukprot:scaffold46472_cov62-Phaeocystis_antarctica.AAC.1